MNFAQFLKSALLGAAIWARYVCSDVLVIGVKNIAVLLAVVAKIAKKRPAVSCDRVIGVPDCRFFRS